MGARALFIGDMHLGRRPGRLPRDPSEHGLDPAALGPAAAWQAAVSAAIERGVAAVVLAGDLVESLEDRFEAAAHLERGIRRLTEAGIAVHAVAGNHDVTALPRLASLLDGLHVMGVGGTWTSEVVAGPEGGFRLVGWSFQREREATNPFSAWRAGLIPRDGLPCIGVLHCDRDRADSPYAPVRTSDFNEGPGAAACAWFLGHIHKPDALAGPRPVGYLGSLVGLDPGEPGCHGPWLVHVEGRGQVSVEQLPLAPIRYEPLTVELSGLDATDASDVQDALFARCGEAFDELHARIDPKDGHLKAVGVRLLLEGAVARPDVVNDLVAESRKGVLQWATRSIEGVLYFAEKVRCAVRPESDLDVLARGSDPVALLAQRLVALRDGGAACEALLDRAAPHLAEEAARGPWARLSTAAPGREQARALLLEAGLGSLQELLAQRTSNGRQDA